MGQNKKSATWQAAVFRLAGNIMFTIGTACLLGLFLVMQRESGGPDQGMELWQRTVPTIGLAAVIAAGALKTAVDARRLTKLHRK